MKYLLLASFLLISVIKLNRVYSHSLGNIPEGNYSVLSTGCFKNGKYYEFVEDDYRYYFTGYYPILTTHMLDFDNVEKINLKVRTRTIEFDIKSKNCFLNTINEIQLNANNSLIVDNEGREYHEPVGCFFQKKYEGSSLDYQTDFVKRYLPFNGENLDYIKMIKDGDDYLMLISPDYGDLLLEEEDEDYTEEDSPLRFLAEAGRSTTCHGSGLLSWKLRLNK